MMNKKGIIWAAVTVALLLVGCDSSKNSIGSEVLPDYLKSKPISKDFKVKIRSVEASTEGHSNNIYVSSSRGYFGSIPNKEFGAIKSEYLTQFYIPQGFKFRDEEVIQKIDSVRLHLYYDGFVGDTISNMAATAYRLAKPLEHNKYTISDITGYVGNELGTASYWAGRGSSKVFDATGKQKGYRISIPVPTELGQEFFNKSKANDPVFANQTAFDQWFSGVYLQITSGQGSVIRISNTELSFYYTKEVEKVDPKTKEKKMVKEAFSQSLIHTSEVPQLSMFVNYNLDKLLASTTHVHIKAPAGSWIEMTIPTTEIEKTLKEAPKGFTRRLNAATYTLQGVQTEAASKNNANKLLTPQTLLMLPKERAKEFFEKERTEGTRSELYTSFLGEITVQGSNAYYFGNIGSVILDHIKKHPGKDLEVLIIPVERISTPLDQGNVTVSLSHLVLPSAMSFVIDDKNTTLEATIIENKSGAPF
ncbi:DUF4270 domain-containing protein [Porphyromonas levii]|uniref:DUF4270 domain-containing protein n=1 Tax=Porphyromonas levii TaxID=28114 RepID=UPI002012A7CC|nr:DUF4270 domain-containing protein [Porphyromonas levii]